jgi:hypothetical protein
MADFNDPAETSTLALSADLPRRGAGSSAEPPGRQFSNTLVTRSRVSP